MTRSVVIGTALPAEAAETTGSETVEVGEWVSTDTESGSRWGNWLPRKQETVNLGVGLAPLPRKLVARIQAGDYVEFGEFPPVAGQEPLDEDLEERVRPGDRRRRSREVPSILFWMSCFTLYKRAVLIEEPNRGAELDAYGESVLDAARSYRWEFVRNYDQKFRAAAVGDTSRSWAYLDTSLFTKEVTCPHAAYVAANARPAAGLDRQPARKRSKPGMEPRGRGGEVEADVCRRFNWQDGQCSFADRCKYRHICSRSRGQHPVGRCSGQRQDWGVGAGGTTPTGPVRGPGN